MNRQEKELVVADFQKMFNEANATFLVDYKGLTVKDMQALRKELREVAGSLKVTKARLMKIATQDIKGAADFSSTFKDQVGLVFAQADVSVTAKKLVEFSKKNEALKLISGFFESKVMNKAEVTVLASLPSREVLLSILLATMQAPTSSLVRLLNLMIVRLLFVLKQIGENKAA